MTILQINSSMHSDDGESSRLATLLVDSLRQQHPAARVIERDLAREPVPHLDAASFKAFATPPAQRDAAQRAAAARSDALIDELRAADLIVLGLPMYNFGVPSALKAYFDHVARAGVTFRYTAEGAQGLLTGKKAYVVATRGGAYAGTAADSQTAFVRQFLGFLGIADVEFLHVEGLALGPARRGAALAQARATIQTLAPPVRLAA